MKVVASFAIISIFGLFFLSGCHGKAGKPELPTQEAQKVPTKSGTSTSTPAQNAPTKVVAEPAGAIKFESTTHDFGNIDPNSKNNAEFKFTNTGKGTLKLQPVQVTCGCTVTELSKLEYTPGETGTIKVQYTSTKAAGPVTKTLFVPSNDPQNPRVELILKANVVIQVDYKPDSLKLSLHQENAGAAPVVITSKDNRPFKIKSFESSSNVISVDFDPNKVDTKFVIPLKVDVDKLKTTLNGYIRFDITHPAIDIITIPYSTPAEFDAQPSSIIVRDAKPGTAVDREIWIKDNYNQPFEIEAVSSRSGLINVVKQERIENMYRLAVQITPPQDDKKLFFTDTLNIKIKGGSEIQVNCRGFYSRTAK